MMINKRLISLCEESKKFIGLTVLMNWIALLCNIMIILFVGDFINSILNKTYPDLDQATKDSWGYTKEKGWPHYSEDYAIYKEMGVTNEEMKDVPPYGMYLAAGGWDEKCDGHNYSNRLVPTIVHHEASTKQEWKVDKKAYDEKIITGYQCACGKTK